MGGLRILSIIIVKLRNCFCPNRKQVEDSLYKLLISGHSPQGLPPSFSVPFKEAGLYSLCIGTMRKSNILAFSEKVKHKKEKNDLPTYFTNIFCL